MTDLDKEFAKNVSCKTTEFGYEISCKKDLWGVECKDQKTAFREAKHYFQQYWSDGEYDGTVVEKMRDRLIRSK